MHQRILTLSLALLLGGSVFGCTAFKVTRKGYTRVGNNEDAWSINARIRFENGGPGAYGAMYLAHFNGHPLNRMADQGGMNTAGLMFDGFSVEPKAVPPRAGLPRSSYPELMGAVMRTCATVEEARAMLTTVDRSFLYRSMIFLVDRNGGYLVVESDTMLLGHDAVYAVGNFRPSACTDFDAVPIPRYTKGRALLASGADTSLAFCTAVMDSMRACRTRIGNGTLYTDILDLDRQRVHLFFYHDFTRHRTFDLHEELAKGDHEYALASLFPPVPEYTELLDYVTPFHQHGLFRGLLVLAGIALLSGVIGSIVLVRRTWSRLRGRAGDGMGRWSALVASSVVLLLLLAVLLTQEDIYYFGLGELTDKIHPLLKYAPAVLCLLTIPVLVHAFRGRRSGASKSEHVVFVAQTVALVVLLPMLFYWHLVIALSKARTMPSATLVAMRPLALLLAFLPVFAIGQDLALMPWPDRVEPLAGRLAFIAPLRARVDGPSSPRIDRAVVRWAARFADRNGPVAKPDTSAKTTVHIHYATVADLKQPDVDGSYTLTIDSSGIRIDAATDIGVLHAFATLYQTLERDATGSGFPALRITDKPRFIWRGLMMDVCRHFMPREVILRELDGMELVKLNVLHLHLSEDQGFRIESTVFPELHQQGSNGDFLSQADIRKIIQEADLRGIRVVPEFDLPGHSTSWFISHPELASAPGPYTIETRFGVFDPTFDPTNEATYALLDRFLGEMAALFPDPYMHIGGDENNGKQWDANPAIQAYMKKNGIADNHALQARFNQRLYPILKKYGKRMIGWDEIGDVQAKGGRTAEQPLPDDITIQSWRGPEGLVKAVRAGHDVLLSNGYYIDLCFSTAEHYLNDPLPTDNPLSAEERKHVLGGEATMWAELVDARNVDTRIWPRTAAIAERLWSDASVKDVTDMHRRLEPVSAQLDAIGLRHKSAQLELLRGLTGTDDVAALKELVDVLTPALGYERHGFAVHTTATPLTGLADAAVPDPRGARLISSLIDGILRNKDTAQASALRRSLAREMEVGQQLPTYKAIVDTRTALGRSALDMLDAWMNGTAPSAATCARGTAALTGAKGPFLECRFADLAAFQRLFDATCGKPR